MKEVLSMTKTVPRGSNFLITQQLNSKYWSRAPVNIFDANKPVEQIAHDLLAWACNFINNAFQYKHAHDAKSIHKNETTYIAFAGILHDKDVTYDYDATADRKIIVPKLPHVHIKLGLKYDRVTLPIIAGILGIEPQYVELPRGRYGSENSLAYLVHAKDATKYKYDPHAVETFGTFNYMSYYVKHADKWNLRRATAQKKDNSIKADWLVKQVQQGAIDKEQIMLTDAYASVYADNMRLFNDAFQFRAEQQGFRTLQALKNHEFELGVYFITGKPGTGKTTFAQQFCNTLVQKRFDMTGEKWHIYQSGSINPMDEYSGEEIILFDDLRSSSMSSSDWLKILDPLTSAPLSARYKNKQKACRIIVITSYIEPLSFFAYMKGIYNDNEALDQFIRRLSMIAKVIRTDLDGRAVSLNEVVRIDKPITATVGNYDTRDYRDVNYLPSKLGTGSFQQALDYLVNDALAKNDKAIAHHVTDKRKVDQATQLFYDDDEE